VKPAGRRPSLTHNAPTAVTQNVLDRVERVDGVIRKERSSENVKRSVNRGGSADVMVNCRTVPCVH